jgi:hypothetical protein
MQCRKRRKSSKKALHPVATPNLYASLEHWSLTHPYGKSISKPLQPNTWIQPLLDSVVPTKGAHIHTQDSKWKFFKINLGTRKMADPAWLDVPIPIIDQINIVAYECMSAALLEIANYKGCTRACKEQGAVWDLPCGTASEICSLLYQPNGASRQKLHTDGHKRYTMPDRPDDVMFAYFLNILVPLVGDIPTVFLSPQRKLQKGPTCGPDMIRIFNGGLWHGGDANNTGTGVWKLFLGLVPGNHPSAGDFPVFEEHAGKNLAEEKQRVILVADDR